MGTVYVFFADGFEEVEAFTSVVYNKSLIFLRLSG